MAELRTRVVVTGLGMVTPMGISHHAFWEGTVSGRSAASSIDTFDVSGYPSRIACSVRDIAAVDALIPNRKALKLMGRATRFGVAAAALAIDDARLNTAHLDPLRCGVSLGVGGVGHHDLDYTEILEELGARIRQDRTDSREMLPLVQQYMNPLTPLKLLPNITASHIAINHNLRGECLTVCTACTSSTQAIGQAVRTLRQGNADVMIAGGTDAMVNSMGLVAFGMLGVLSTRNDDPARAARPFDRDRDGFVIGEGGVTLVLETADHARRRGARVLAEVTGYGVAADAYRITDEPEDGRGSAEAMRRALADAGRPPDDVDYVNAHGTGTRMNDRTETRAMKTVFGEHCARVLVGSTKSQVGHLVAAAGAVEAAACVLALIHQIAPPSINVEHLDAECDVALVGEVGRPARLDVVMSNSFGFGGQNACLVLERWRESNG